MCPGRLSTDEVHGTYALGQLPMPGRPFLSAARPDFAWEREIWTGIMG